MGRIRLFALFRRGKSSIQCVLLMRLSGKAPGTRSQCKGAP